MSIKTKFAIKNEKADKEEKKRKSLEIYIKLGGSILDQLRSIGIDCFSKRSTSSYFNQVEQQLKGKELQSYLGEKVIIKLDEMSIDNGETSPFIGFHNNNKSASHVLQFYITDAHTGLSIPGSFVCIKTINSEILHELIMKEICNLELCNHTVEAVVLDGYSAHSKWRKSVTCGTKSLLDSLPFTIVFDPVHSFSLIWRILVCRNIQIAPDIVIDKSILSAILLKEQLNPDERVSKLRQNMLSPSTWDKMNKRLSIRLSSRQTLTAYISHAKLTDMFQTADENWIWKDFATNTSETWTLRYLLFMHRIQQLLLYRFGSMGNAVVAGKLVHTHLEKELEFFMDLAKRNAGYRGRDTGIHPTTKSIVKNTLMSIIQLSKKYHENSETMRVNRLWTSDLESFFSQVFVIKMESVYLTK